MLQQAKRSLQLQCAHTKEKSILFHPPSPDCPPMHLVNKEARQHRRKPQEATDRKLQQNERYARVPLGSACGVSVWSYNREEHASKGLPGKQGKVACFWRSLSTLLLALVTHLFTCAQRDTSGHSTARHKAFKFLQNAHGKAGNLRHGGKGSELFGICST